MRKGTIGDFSKKNLILAWIDSPMCAESNSVSFKINITNVVMAIFMHSGRYICFSDKTNIWY